MNEQKRRRPRILALTRYYYPGFRAGGPVRSLINLVKAVDSKVDIVVVAADHDAGESERYKGVVQNGITDTPVGPVWYVPRFSCWSIHRVVRELRPDLIYLNSLFSKETRSTLALRRVGIIRNPVILAPRGELDPGAIRLKRRRKRLFVRASRRMSLLEGVWWQATSIVEAEFIRREFRVPDEHVAIIGNIPSVIEPSYDIEKTPGDLRLLFLSRVSVKKNLLFALSSLARVKARVTLAVAGPVEDARYWARCEDAIHDLPAHISVTYMGPIPHDRIGSVFKDVHATILPTLGENFGHSIVESLLAARPVIISDKTPWQLTGGGGWSLPLESERWCHAVEELAAMEYSEWRRHAVTARTVAQSFLDQEPRFSGAAFIDLVHKATDFRGFSPA
jgi:glycosyltransferase involved in cell wall biosynthesis